MPSLFRYPVPPTHEVQIDFETSGGRSKTLVRMLAPSEGAWREVLPCPTVDSVRMFRERQAAAKEQRAGAEQLAAAIDEPLLSELRQLLAGRHRIEAIRTYQERSGLDVTTAMQVIDVIDGR